MGALQTPAPRPKQVAAVVQLETDHPQLSPHAREEFATLSSNISDYVGINFHLIIGIVSS